MKRLIAFGFDVSPKAYPVTQPGELPRIAQHEYLALPDGRLEHRINGAVRALVPAEGLVDYAETWPDCEPVVAELIAAEKSAGASLAAAVRAAGAGLAGNETGE